MLKVVPIRLRRDANAFRVWQTTHRNRKDDVTLDGLLGAALHEVAAILTNDKKTDALLRRVKTERKGKITQQIERRVSWLIASRLSIGNNRQRVRSAGVNYHVVPLPDESRLAGTVIVRAWGHEVRSTFDPVIGYEQH